MVVTAGVPCKGFSLSNRKRHAEDERNYLFKEFIRVVRELKPAAVVLENVSGLVSTKNGKFKRDIAVAIGELVRRTSLSLTPPTTVCLNSESESSSSGSREGADGSSPPPSSEPRVSLIARLATRYLATCLSWLQGRWRRNTHRHQRTTFRLSCVLSLVHSTTTWHHRTRRKPLTELGQHRQVRQCTPHSNRESGCIQRLLAQPRSVAALGHSFSLAIRHRRVG